MPTLPIHEALDSSIPDATDNIANDSIKRMVRFIRAIFFLAVSCCYFYLQVSP